MREKIVQNVKQTSLSITQNAIQAIRCKDVKKTGCRIYRDSKIGIAGGLGNISADILFARAEKQLAYAVDYPVKPTENLSSKTDLAHFRISDEELCQRIQNILQACRKQHPDFAISNKVNSTQISLELRNAAGLDLCHRDAYLSLSFLLKGKESTGIMDTFFGLVDRKLEDNLVIAAVNEIITAYKNKLSMPSKSLPIVIDQGSLTRVFQRDLNGKLVGNKASLFQAQIGSKVFADAFNLKIANDPEETYGPIFDMEGIVVEEPLTWLIKDGVILRPYTDKKTAAKFDFDNTGCAGGAYDSAPSLGNCNMEIPDSGKSLKQLLNGQQGIIISIASGGDFTPDGQFATPVQVAHLTDGEHLLGRLPEFSIKGSVFDFFGKNFIGVSSDRVYTCGNERMAVVELAIEKL